MAGYDVVHAESGGAAVQSLPAEDAAERAVILLSNCRDNAVHCPSVQFVIRENLERHVILLLIALDGLMIQVNTKWPKGQRESPFVLTSSESSR